MSVRPSVHLSVGVEQLDSHWTDFHEILYLSIFRKSAETVLLKYDKKKTGTSREDICYNISLSSF